MQVRDIMSSPAITVQPETKIQAVARMMRENQISGVPVVNENGALLGAVTELDLIARNAPLKQPHYLAVLSAVIPLDVNEYQAYKEQLRQTLATNARELMSPVAHTVEPTTPLETVMELMR